MKVLSLKIICCLSLVIGFNSAWALPMLQLGIIDGTYDTATETVVTSGGDFTLVAYGKATGNKSINLATDYYISIAVSPKIAEFPVPDIGTFDFQGNTYDISDMSFGNPPLEANLEHDPKDLSSHSIFDTYFLEFVFNFSGSTSASVNTENTPGFDPFLNSGSDLYYQTFDIDITGLLPGFGLHFDLYSTEIKSGDTDVNKFAPYSHDAGTTIAAVPEPDALLLFSLVLMLLCLTRGVTGRKV